MSVRVLVVEDEELSALAHADYVRRTAGFELVAVARSAGALIAGSIGMPLTFTRAGATPATTSSRWVASVGTK